MEGFSNVFLFLIFGTGLLFLIRKTSRKIGLLLILAALFFLYLWPKLDFWRFKQGAIGRYTDHKKSELLLQKDQTYHLFLNGKEIQQGEINFSSIDAYPIQLDGLGEFILSNETLEQVLVQEPKIFYRIK